MPRILLAAATLGYQTRSLADAARRLGIDVVLATDRCHVLEDPWLDRALPVRFDDPAESAALLDHELSATPIDGLIALGDTPTTLAAMTAEHLGLPFHSSVSTARCRDKGLSREAFERAGMPVPRRVRFGASEDAAQAARIAAAVVKFPCVLKPVALSASRGVIRANNAAEFRAAFRRIRKILALPDVAGRDHAEGFIQAEQYIPGREFAIEGLMTRGDLRILALFDKPDPLEGPFFEETIYVTPSREPAPVQQQIEAAVRNAVRALGLSHGPVHAEARVNPDGVWMLEVAARPIGGLCARVLKFHAGDSLPETTLEDLLVRHAAGLMPETLRPARAASGVMMLPIPRAGIYRGVTGLERARAAAGIDDAIIAAIPGQHLLPPPEGGSYLGFLFASGPDPASAEASLRAAHAALDFDISGALDIITR